MPAARPVVVGMEARKPVSAASMLSVRNVTRSFSGASQPALHDVSLDVAPGEFVTVIGPSGCGKTTLLRIVGGLLSPTSGDVFVDGKESLGPSTDKAIVFQHFNLFPWRTVLANAAYGLEIQGMPKDQRNTRATEYLKLLGLEGYEGYFPGQLSGGMRQRVGIARALAVRPRVLLMDEPFGALDALNREYLQGELEKIVESGRLTVLFITHSIDEAIYLSDRIIVMGTRPGRIVNEFDVSLRRPRWQYDVRTDPEFADLRARIWTILRREMAAGTDAAPTGSGD
ncbi:MAG TPA: ABC transporter ATP-binding protein [Candidatus Dormibacteraeota bacterium]